MREEAEILSRIAEYNGNLVVIEERIQQELQKHYTQRNQPLLLFLNKERSVWEFAVVQMKWLLGED